MLQDEYDLNPYLQQEVLSASPVRLRWMLINQAVELCGAVENFWTSGDVASGDQWILRVRDILGELLSGITSGNPVSQQVADFYLFLLKLQSDIERSRSLETLSTLKELLVIEADTWRMVLEKSMTESMAASKAASQSKATSDLPIMPTFNDFDEASSGSSFSLDM